MAAGPSRKQGPGHLAKIAFIDLEASGLHPLSWPIEVGWCFLSGSPVTDLIRPDDGWAQEAWDEAAEELHGISRDELEASGRPAGEICERLNAALADAAVYSDAPDWDSFWLYRLFTAGQARQNFRVLDFGELFADIEERVFIAAKTHATSVSPHEHRAKSDVLHMRTLFQRLSESRSGP